MLIDTYKLIEDMIAAGIKKPQAEIITNAINQSNDNLVTKSDLKLAISEVKSEVNLVKSEVQSVRSEMSTLKWMVGLVCALMIMMISLLLTSKL